MLCRARQEVYASSFLGDGRGIGLGNGLESLEARSDVQRPCGGEAEASAMGWSGRRDWWSEVGRGLGHLSLRQLGNQEKLKGDGAQGTRDPLLGGRHQRALAAPPTKL